MAERTQAPEALIWVCEKGHVDDQHYDTRDMPGVDDLCSRCGGKCTLFRSLDFLAREYIERLRVNVGLLAENSQLKRKLREGGSGKDLDSIVGDLRAEVESLRKPKAAEFPDFEGGWASCEEALADSLQQLIDRYSGGGE